MEISDILCKELIADDFAADDKRDFLQKMAEFVADKCQLDANVVFEAVLERENLGSTGCGKGVAFPHARIDGLEKLIVAFARLRQAIDFESPDDKKVDLVAFMISPENSGDDHLRALAALSRVLKNDEVCMRLRRAKTAAEIYKILQD